MKRIHEIEYLRRLRGELIASWGEAELLRHLDGHYELRGGTPDDRQAAREWISLFLHEAAVTTGVPRFTATRSDSPQSPGDLSLGPSVLHQPHPSRRQPASATPEK